MPNATPPLLSCRALPCRWWAPALLAALVGCAQPLPSPPAAAAAPGAVATAVRTADPDLKAPQRVLLHVHASVVDRRFMPALQAALERSFVAPVQVRDSTLDLAPARPAPDAPVDADLMTELLSRQTDWAREADSYHVLLVADDVRGSGNRFSFALNHGGAQTPYRATVVSLARLQPLTRISDFDVAPQRTADRAYKMIARSLAKTAGLTDSEACVLATPRNLRELDEMPARFCEADAALLLRSGILKAGARPGA